MEKVKLKKIGNIALNVLLFFFLSLCIIAVLITAFSKRDIDGTVEIGGYQMRVITSDSMEKCELTDVSDYNIKSIPVRSMVFIELVPEDPQEADEWYADLKVGDVLTFKYVYTHQVTITHRITDIERNNVGGYSIELAGDNKSSNSDQLYQSINTSTPNNKNYVIGKVTGQSYILGFIVSLLKTTLGIILMVIVPCLIIILLEVLKIVGLYKAEKKKRQFEEDEKKDNEIKELRSKLAMLEKVKSKEPPKDDTITEEDTVTKEDTVTEEDTTDTD